MMVVRGLLFAAVAFTGLASSVQADDLVSRGEYLARAADCVACHTAPGGHMFAGGERFVLPFGTLYSPNITPDPKTGIGDYGDDDWLKMLQHGVARDGKRLYPVMPYTAYAKMSRDDALAIKAYLFSLKPIEATAPPNALKFPYDQRWGLVFWNLVNASDKPLEPDTAKPEAWNRGAYLVEALGHCAECHTPRNFMQGLKDSAAYAGALQQGWLAYNLSSDRTNGIGGWSDDQLTQYLSTGQAPGRGPASGPMAEVVEDSLRYLTPEDIAAIITYLRTIPAQTEGPPAITNPVQPIEDASGAGAHIFLQACAGCHLPDGTGRQSPWAALGGAHSVGDVSGTNLLQIIAHGSQIDTAQGLMFMHSFTGGYSDAELAEASNYLIGQMSGRQGQVTAEEIKALHGPDDHKPTDPPPQP